MTDDPFKPLGKAGKPKLRVVSNASDFVNVAPIPADAPPVPTHLLGEPTRASIYLDAQGRELGRVLRFDRDGEKEFRPLTLWRKGSGALAWRWSSWPEPRPLYGLHGLAKRPSAPVVVTEGEKAADAAQRLLSAYVVVTSPGGSSAAAKADWTPLAGRTITVWGDADAAGLKYAEAVASAAEKAGAASVAIVAPPAGVVAGWDAADAETEGWTPAKADELVRTAAPAGRGSSGKQAAGDDGAAKNPGRSRRGIEGIIDLIKGEGVELWCDPEQNVFATVVVKEHRESYAIESKAFSEWVVRTAYERGLTPPGLNLLKEVILFLSARAHAEGTEKTPIRRSGWRAGKLYLDLCDRTWRVVEIDDRGWRILEQHDAPIVRSKYMRPLRDPEGGGSIGDLYRFLNTGDDGRKLIVGWLLMALAGQGPYPILMFKGEDGSAKSTMTRLVKTLIDPSSSRLRALPREERVLAISARHNHVLAFDNASGIDGEMSDALCRVSTGGGLSSKVLYTDADEYVVDVKNPIILNGIPNLANRPDLASRALLITLNPIPETERKTEKEVEAEWGEVAHNVLGVLLDALSCALRRLPDTKLSRSGRMADFEQFVEAAASALDWEEGEFSEVMRESRSGADDILISESEVASAVVSFIKEEQSRQWEGPASVLLERLSTKVSDATRRSRSWPNNPTMLGKALTRFASTLRRQGIDCVRGHSGARFWRIDATAYVKTDLQPEAARDPGG